MLHYNQYLRAKDLEEAYTLYQKKNNAVAGGMLWMKMQSKNLGCLIDLCDLGLDQVEEKEDCFLLGAYVSLHALETDPALNAYTCNALRDAVKHIVGVQFRNCATLGGSIWGRYGFSDVMTIFRALNASVILYKGGEMSLDEFLTYSRLKRDILTHIRVPKNMKAVVYQSLRNQSTDFPVLTCAVAYDGQTYRTVLGATPYIAQLITDEDKLPKDAGGITEDTAAAFAAWVEPQIRFDSNMRAGAQYRSTISKVLVRRCLMEIKNIIAEKEA